jgi:hypothetical protein
MRGRKPAPNPEQGPDGCLRFIVIGVLVLIWMAHCTPLGKLPEPMNSEQHWRERG